MRALIKEEIRGRYGDGSPRWGGKRKSRRLWSEGGDFPPFL